MGVKPWQGSIVCGVKPWQGTIGVVLKLSNAYNMPTCRFFQVDEDAVTEAPTERATVLPVTEGKIQ